MFKAVSVILNKEECKDQVSIHNHVPHLTQGIILENDRTQENITHKRTKRSALSQQVTSRLQGKDNTV